MRSLILLLTLVGWASCLRWGINRLHLHDPPPAVTKAAADRYETLWFDQQLDHFDIMNTPSWRQRYWVNLDHYVDGGPAMIMIGGEAEANPGWLDYGFWSGQARQHGAAMFLLEHRYYGQSHPTPDMATPNMRYLSSRQGLEDLAAFIAAMTRDYNLTGPWISYGGSYPGSLSAWLRLKYPHLVAGAVSSSGPLHAKLDFFEYLSVVESALASTGPGCVEAITEAMAELGAVEATNATAWDQISSLFMTCQPIDGNMAQDVASMTELLIDNLAGVVQYNGRTEFDIYAVCDIMRDYPGTPLERFAALNAVSLDGECLDHEFSSFLALLTNTDWTGAGVGWRQWTWQTCTEFGWYQTTNQPMEVFGRRLDLDFFESWCRLAFSEAEFTHERMAAEMAATNAEYGGFTPDVRDVVFVHGSIDPWHAMGVLEDLSEAAPAIFIPGTSHCADMYDDKETDPPELREAREQVAELVAQWVNKK